MSENPYTPPVTRVDTGQPENHRAGFKIILAALLVPIWNAAMASGLAKARHWSGGLEALLVIFQVIVLPVLVILLLQIFRRFRTPRMRWLTFLWSNVILTLLCALAQAYHWI